MDSRKKYQYNLEMNFNGAVESDADFQPGGRPKPPAPKAPQWTRCPTGEEAVQGGHTSNVNENALYNHGMERGQGHGDI